MKKVRLTIEVEVPDSVKYVAVGKYGTIFRSSCPLEIYNTMVGECWLGDMDPIGVDPVILNWKETQVQVG